jgi:predicted 3-demethylubiquinone-9 3-methyltransferase (glyoxalase superfamily)
MLKLLQGEDKERARRAMQAMMEMVKLDIKTLEKA